MKKLGHTCDPRALHRIGATSVNAAESAENCAYEPDNLDLSGLAAAEAAIAAEKTRAPLIKAAKAALVKSDAIAVRCMKAGVSFPTGWETWTENCRAIVNGTDTTSTAVPAQPPYPAGT